MKKIYYLAGALLVGATGFAQVNHAVGIEKSISQPTTTRTDLGGDRAPGDVIGSIMDFSDASMWDIDNSATDPGGWVIGTAAPSGPFSGGMGVIESTSGGDFALFDADGTTGEASITMADPIDLSAYPNVAIEFESYYRAFNGSCFVQISNNGTDWESFPVHELVPLNESTANPEFVSINISDIAGEEATVWARFVYNSTDDYAWMIDDVRFTEGYSNQLIIGQTYLSCGEQALDYYMIPESQVSPFTFGARVSNNGVNDQTNTTLNVAGGGYDENSTAVTVSAFSTDSLELTDPSWTPSTGSYSLTYTVGSADFTDELMEDNATTLEEISVGGNVYARDNGVSTGSVGYLGGTPPVTVMGNYFEFFGDFGLGHIDVFVAAGDAGEIIYGEVKLWDGSDFITVAVAEDYELTAGDAGTWVRLNLEDILPCSAGEIYMIGAGHYGSSTVRVSTGQIAEGAVIYGDGDAFQQNSVFMVRAVEAFASIDETAGFDAQVSVYPNPVNENAFVSYTLAENAKVTFTITDLSGKVVLSADLGNQAAGTYQEVVNAENLSEGTYFITLNVDGHQSVEKLVVTK